MIKFATAATIYQQLQKLGFKRRYIKNIVLPEWWDDQIATTKSGYLIMISYIAKNLGLDLTSLLEEEKPIMGRYVETTKTKKRIDISSDDLKWARNTAIHIAHLATMAFEKKGILHTSADEIRRHILKSEKFVNLETLISYCWQAGIPVLHVPEFPTKKMDGLSIKVNNRYVIVISKNCKYPAWLLFILAHELGHIILNHFCDTSIIVDQSIITDKDQEEIEANQFASEILTENSDFEFDVKYNISGKELANKAKEYSEKSQIDPGFLALNYAWQTTRYGVANNALNIIEREYNAVEIINKNVLKNIIWEKLVEDNQGFLKRVCNIQNNLSN